MSEKDTAQQNFFEFCAEQFEAIKQRLNLRDSSGMHYLAQISSDNEEPTPTYAFQLGGVGNLLAPVTFMNTDEEKVRRAVLQFADDVNVDFVEEAFHLAQAEHAEKIMNFHKEQAKNVKTRVAVEGPTTIGKIRKGYKEKKNA